MKKEKGFLNRKILCAVGLLFGLLSGYALQVPTAEAVDYAKPSPSPSPVPEAQIPDVPAPTSSPIPEESESAIPDVPAPTSSPTPTPSPVASPTPILVDEIEEKDLRCLEIAQECNFEAALCAVGTDIDLANCLDNVARQHARCSGACEFSATPFNCFVTCNSDYERNIEACSGMANLRIDECWLYDSSVLQCMNDFWNEGCDDSNVRFSDNYWSYQPEPVEAEFEPGPAL